MGKRYFCDYCGTYLTHDSASVRKTHNNGKKHKDNVREYYEEWFKNHFDVLQASGINLIPVQPFQPFNNRAPFRGGGRPPGRFQPYGRDASATGANTSELGQRPQSSFGSYGAR
eukprot:m.71325 g.71325  ORF g.71325 m.71325 type:complete len:114 (-) comp50178_c0_seq1:650-991(-)